MRLKNTETRFSLLVRVFLCLLVCGLTLVLFPGSGSSCRGFFIFGGWRMRQVILVRGPSSDEGTVGMVYVGGQYCCRSIELPDRGNRRNISRIPAGAYRCVWHRSPRFGWCYRVVNVPGRSHILIHPANWGGDRDRGYRSDLYGCIGLGTHAGLLVGQRAVLASRTAISRFNELMDCKPFSLTILEARGVRHY